MNIAQSDIWMVEFFPQKGSEITKVRPAVVVSSDIIGKLPLKTVVPITDWSKRYADYPWMLKIDASSENGLSKTSAIDCFQIKSFSTDRFKEKLGNVDDVMIYNIHATIIKTFNPLYGLTPIS